MQTAGTQVTPVWSPDGSELVYASDQDGDFEIFILTATGQKVQLTFNTSEDIHPSWSPDGQRVLFASNQGGSYYQVYTIPKTGGAPELVTSIANNILWPRYSPDGSKIVYMRASLPLPACDWNWDIWVMESNGSNQTPLTNWLGGDLYPSWTPDGEIVYSSCRNFLTADLYLKNPLTGIESQMTAWPAGNELGAVYAFDGSQVAFSSNVNGNYDVYIAPTAGGTAVNLTTSVGEDMTPSWQGSGGALPPYFISGEVTLTQLPIPIKCVTVTVNTGQQAITDEEGSFYIDNLPSGSYTLTVAKSNYIFEPVDELVVPPNREGITIRGQHVLATDVNELVGETLFLLGNAQWATFDTGLVGDYFRQESSIAESRRLMNLFVNTITLGFGAIDGWDSASELDRVAMPGLSAAVADRWYGWSANSAAAHYWRKAVLDAIADNPEMVFSEVSWAGLRFAAEEWGMESVTELLSVISSQPTGAPLQAYLVPKYSFLITSLQSELLDLQIDTDVVTLPYGDFTDAELALYRADLQSRLEANQILADQVFLQTALLKQNYDDYRGDLFGDFWRNLLLKYSVIAAATFFWDGPGFYVASVATDSVELIYEYVQDTQDIKYTEQMADASFRLLTGHIPFLANQISLNTANGLNLIRYGLTPEPPSGQIDAIVMRSIGEMRSWPFSGTWLEREAQVEIEIRNASNDSLPTPPTTYLTSMVANQNQEAGDVPLLIEGEAVDLIPNAMDTAVIRSRSETYGIELEVGTPLMITILGATESGIYPVYQESLLWNPIHNVSGSMAASHIAANIPYYSYPLAATLHQQTDSTDYLRPIRVTNPFTMTVDATITQALPTILSVQDADGGQIAGQQIVWTATLDPGETRLWQPVFQWDGQPTSQGTLLGTVLSFVDSQTGLGDTYLTDDISIVAPWPLTTQASVPLAVFPQTTSTISVTVTNESEAAVQGDFIYRLESPAGAVLSEEYIPLALSGGASSTMALPLPSLAAGDQVVATGLVKIGTQTRTAFYQIIPTSKAELFLPILVK
ncbi:MAG: DUF2012 domain-containing protein [bacterium]|nr:DUF2012 domain-containing protein [bacterium]